MIDIAVVGIGLAPSAFGWRDQCGPSVQRGQQVDFVVVSIVRIRQAHRSDAAAADSHSASVGSRTCPRRRRSSRGAMAGGMGQGVGAGGQLAAWRQRRGSCTANIGFRISARIGLQMRDPALTPAQEQ